MHEQNTASCAIWLYDKISFFVIPLGKRFWVLSEYLFEEEKQEIALFQSPGFWCRVSTVQGKELSLQVWRLWYAENFS